MTTNRSSIEKCVMVVGDYVKTRTVGVNRPSLEAAVPYETGTSFEQRNRLLNALDQLDDHIRNKSTEYFNFITCYRDGGLPSFVNSINLIHEHWIKNPFSFKDKIHWTEELSEITPLRKDLSQCYLSLFKDFRQDQVIVDDDFWKCLDSEQLLLAIKKAPLFTALPRCFVDPQGLDTLKTLNQTLTTLLDGVALMSKEYEQVIARLLDMGAHRQDIAPVECIDFSKHQATILGVSLTAFLPNIIQRVWHGVDRTHALANTYDDLKFLLAEPLSVLNGSVDNSTRNIHTLHKNTNSPAFIEMVEQYRRSATQLVDLVNVSSKRLTIVADDLRQLPIKAEDGESETVNTLCALCSLYSASLYEVLTFTLTSSQSIETGLSTGVALGKHVTEITSAIKAYVQKRNLK